MKLNSSLRLLLMSAASLAVASPALASFHIMQIEQVMGGVSGDTTRQAIQLRMRQLGQNQMQFSRIRAWDAAGANPVLIVDMGAPVLVSTAGSRVLIASPAFGIVSPDFTTTNLIPVGYLAAGKLTFEDDGGFVYWSLAWGGAAYTGTNTSGDTTNDADTNFNPPFPSPLPSSNTQAVRFTGVASAPSTNNAADYALTAGAAVFTNNAGLSGTVPVELMDFKVE